jgi:hypothetical protein
MNFRILKRFYTLRQNNKKMYSKNSEKLIPLTHFFSSILRFWTLIFLFIILISSWGCKSKNSNNLTIDIPKEEAVEIRIHRYEKVLMSIDANNLRNELRKYKDEYAFFLNGNLEDTLNIIKLYNYISDPTLHEIYDDLINKYPEVTNIEKDLSESFTYYKHYFPNKTIPKVYTYISYLDFNNRIIYLDTVMAIALDMYLGADYKLYSSVKIPHYISNRLDSSNIVIDCMKTIAQSNLSFNPDNKTLLDNIIYLGKILYFTDAMLPNVKDELKISYTKNQLEWCNKNEEEIWAFFIKNNLLYNVDYYKIRQFFTEAPTTKGFNNSPPRFGEWIGWQIVKAYMNENNKITLAELLEENDSQKILHLSKYKPKKQ